MSPLQIKDIPATLHFYLLTVPPTLLQSHPTALANTDGNVLYLIHSHLPHVATEHLKCGSVTEELNL
jgi:hypothetical protein